MKKRKLFLILILISIFFISFSFATISSANDLSELSTISSETYFIMDNRTNKVLYSKEENKKMYPASTTKILTAIIVLENCNLDDVVTASYDAIMSIPQGYFTTNIQIGEQLTVEQLLELLLVPSANDAANVLAEYIGGTNDSFVAMMNTKINELGLTNTHFTNVYGLHDENHYTTAHDLAFIMKYCLKNDTFRRIAGQASCSIPTTNKYGTRSYNSSNELLIYNNENYYKYLTTGKTGFTSNAKECLVSSAYRDDLELICVVLGSNNRFADTKTLYEFAYSNYSIKNIVNENDIMTTIKISNATKDTENLDLLVTESIPALVNSNDSISEITPEIILNNNIYAPIEEGSVLGRVKYTINGISYTTDLIASENVEKSTVSTYILYSIMILLGILITYLIFFHKKKIL